MGPMLPPPHVAWLLTNARVLATAEVAVTRRERAIGLLGRPGISGCLVLERTRWVHTLGMRFDIDVAYVDRQGVVLRTECLKRHRVGRPVRHATLVIEAEAGSFERWELRAGAKIELRR